MILQAEADTDEVYAQITLLPESNVSLCFWFIGLKVFGWSCSSRSWFLFVFLVEYSKTRMQLRKNPHLLHHRGFRCTLSAKPWLHQILVRMVDFLFLGDMRMNVSHLWLVFQWLILSFQYTLASLSWVLVKDSLQLIVCFFFPQDMSRQPPTQELVAKDLHANEWRFKHIFRGIGMFMSRILSYVVAFLFLSHCVIKLLLLLMLVMMLYQVNHGDICFRVDGACLLAPRGWLQAMHLYF